MTTVTYTPSKDEEEDTLLLNERTAENNGDSTEN